MEPREAGGKITPGVCSGKEKKSLRLKSAMCQHLERALREILTKSGSWDWRQRSRIKGEEGKRGNRRGGEGRGGKGEVELTLI